LPERPRTDVPFVPSDHGLEGRNQIDQKPMKKRKIKLAELRSGQPVLNNGQPAKWLVEAVGQEAATAAVLFEAQSVEMMPEGVVVRLGEGRAA
jgi:hypothetical protein